MPMDIVKSGSTKRRAKIFGLRTFGGPGCPMEFAGAFRDNIRVFLRECSDVEDYNVEMMPVWCTLLVDEQSGIVVPLYTVEQSVRCSVRPFCDYCRCSGWSHHFVSKRRYHLLIPSDEVWDKPLDQTAFDLHNHLLHGVIHGNGFGHLICINGLDGGSKHICGRDLMDLWDRLCTSLRVCQVTVEDVSRKKSMDLRLLLGVAYGLTWFGRWGYRFGVGSFGVTESIYQSAINLLSSLDLCDLIDEFKKIGRDRELRRILHTYGKPTRPITLRDLLRCLLEFKNRKIQSPPRPLVPAAPKPRVAVNRKRIRYFEDMVAVMDSRWPIRRLQYAAEVIINALKEHGGMMTRQEVRDAARLTIGDTGLLDFVIKSIGDCSVGNHVVRRTPNRKTKVLEFTVEDLGGDPDPFDALTAPDESGAVSTHPSQSQVERDTAWVYKHVLRGVHPDAAEAVLNSKIWIKTWPLRDEEDDRLRFLCSWIPNEVEVFGGHLTKPLPPPEVVVLPPHAAVGELRREAERALRDTYFIFEGFVSTKVEGVEGREWDPLFGGVESGAHVWVKGIGVDVGSELRYEGGEERWTVQCSCGATDDDGERMVACDLCEVWQHTRCIGIDDSDAPPPLVLCAGCGGSAIGYVDDVMTEEMYS